MQRSRRLPSRYQTSFTLQAFSDCSTLDCESDESGGEMYERQTTKSRRSHSPTVQRQQSKTRTAKTQRQRQRQPGSRKPRAAQRGAQAQEKTRAAASRKRKHSVSSSDDGEEDKHEKRKKQKRDYARRKTQRTNQQLDSLASDCQRWNDKNNEVKQQIRDLIAWMKFAESWLALCRHLNLRHPAPQPTPPTPPPSQPEARTPDHSMTSEVEMTSSLLPILDVWPSHQISDQANGTVAWTAAGNEFPNTDNNLIQTVDPDLAQLENAWQTPQTLLPAGTSLVAPDPAFPTDTADMNLLEDHVVNGIFMEVQQGLDIHSAVDELIQCLPDPSDIM